MVFPVLADWLSVPPEVEAVRGVATVLVFVTSCALLILAKYAAFLVPAVGLAAAAYKAFFPVGFFPRQYPLRTGHFLP